MQNKFIVESYLTGSPDLSVFAVGKSDTPVISHTPKVDSLVDYASSSSPAFFAFRTLNCFLFSRVPG